MRTPIDYLCQFCQRPGVAYYDDSCPGMHLDVWRKILACNHCADFREGVNRFTESIARSARSFAILQTSKLPEIRTESARTTREKLTVKTKDFAAHVCKFHHITNQWEEDFVEIIMERPDMVLRLLKDYERRIAKIAEDAHAPAGLI